MGFAKLWDNILDNPKVRCLPLREFQGWILLLAVASKYALPKGQLPSITEIAFHLRMGEKQAESIVKSLAGLALLDFDGSHYYLHDFEHWNGVKDATAAARQASYRARRASSYLTRKDPGNNRHRP
jgi:hypothetical protein